MLGAIVFFIGLALRLFLYWRGQWNLSALAKGVLSTFLSAKIAEFIKNIFLDGILQRRLFGQDKLRWLMKVLIMIGYPGILLAGHLKVEVMPQFEKVPHLLRFFYAPFCDFYFFRDMASSSLPLSDALFAISFDLFGAMILRIHRHRRFVAKVAVLRHRSEISLRLTCSEDGSFSGFSARRPASLPINFRTQWPNTGSYPLV
jgi:hypothetical protein